MAVGRSNLYAAVCKACSYFGETTAAFPLLKGNILILKLYLQKSLSYGKDPNSSTHVCKISILICQVFFVSS